MTKNIRILITTSFLFCSILIFGQENIPDSVWTKKELKKANTARFSFYLKKESRKSIQLINLTRMNPFKFYELNAINYYNENSIQKNAYTVSLLATLQKTKPMKPLRPSISLFLSSYVHAVYSKYTGHSGHKYFKERIIWTLNFAPYTGEVCSYGYNKADDIVFQLLIDEGIPSLGHRTNILDRNFKKIGNSIKKHKIYNYNCVINFKGESIFKNIFSF